MRHFARIAACALACIGATPALAHPGHEDVPGAAPMAEAAPPPVYAPAPDAGPGTAPIGDRYDHRPVWKEPREPRIGAPSLGAGSEGRPRVMMDPRARDAWLDDCHRNMRRKHAYRCEDYLDDYYAYYERAYADHYAHAASMRVAAPARDCVETVVTEEPAPVIRRHIPRRAPARRDKRIRLD